MPLIYKPVQSNMTSEDGEKKWFPHIVKIKKRVTTDTLAEELSDISALSRGDVHSVIQNLLRSFRHHLLNSETIHLDGFGTFTIKANSAGNGVSTPQEVSSKQINHLTVQFTPCFKRTPGVGITYPMFKGVEFVREDKVGNRGGKQKTEPEEE
ncbi:HU family DNA-binding protein [Bacteroides sp. 51]|uniref:HU family DNA-binding protein n=1 Tax=Bacteroides sp. 51 TaxID=2302938 RepID=UPI0013D8C990|nr:HU family DNA-binding protein [Bacteroides sp. 51]NDV82714.1 DNA-binding protein [Bacteroides sp. 51]